MNTTTLKNTNIQITPLTIGCWAMAGGDFWGDQDEAAAINSVHAALDAGINSFDTAEIYGDGLSEEILGRALLNKRDQAVIASKVWPTNMHPTALRKACEQSLSRLQTDYIDLYQLHWCPRDVPLADAWGELKKLQSEGKVRTLGVSNFGALDLADLLEIGEPTFNQLPYNLLARTIEDAIIPTCIENHMAIFCYSPIMQGLLAGKFDNADDVPDGRARTRHFNTERKLARHGEPGHEELLFDTINQIRKIAQDVNLPMATLAMAWLFKQPGVTSLIIGVRNPDQVARALTTIDVELDDQTFSELNQVTTPLKQALGPNPDLWCSTADSRYR